MNLSPAQEIIGLIIGGIAIFVGIMGIGKYFARAEDRMNHLEKKNLEKVNNSRSQKCDPIFICPYTADIKELKESLSEVRENVAELKGTVSGIYSSVEFIGNYLRGTGRKISE